MAGLLILVSGVLFLTSGGSQKNIDRAKDIFKNLIIGLIIIYVSWLAVGTLIKTIARTTGDFEPQSWNSFKCN